MKWVLILIVLSIALGCLQTQPIVEDKKPEVWIEIHDVSPGWQYWRLEQVLNVTEKYPDAYSKVVLFVIPNHANSTPIYAYPEYIQLLKVLSAKGHIIGLHGYAHPTPPKYEFNCTLEEAQHLLHKARWEFESAGLKFPTYFAPPGWQTSLEVSTYINAMFDYVYYGNYTKTPDGLKPYTSHEYTWYADNSSLSLTNAKKDYLESKEVFRLTIHLEAANTEEGLIFLDEFLGWIEKGEHD